MNDYIPVLMLILFAIFLGAVFIIISSLLGRVKGSKTDLMPYECGVNQATQPRRPIQVKFFLIAIIFLLFDVEVALLYPWAALFRKFLAEGSGKFILMEGLLFMAVLIIGLLYIYRTEALEWKD